MNGFLRGWKRKLGLACLALACLVMIEWLRSSVRPRQYSIHLGRRISDTIVTQDGWIYWISVAPTQLPDFGLVWNGENISFDIDDDVMVTFFLEQGSNQQTRQSVVLWDYDHELVPYLNNWIFHALNSPVEQPKTEFPVRIAVIPFWMISTPLILLAVFLILSRHADKALRPIQRQATRIL